jgi:hypothetical protein
MDTAGGSVHIANSKFVTPKTLGIFKAILDGFSDGGHGLSTIMFRDDGFPVVGDGENITTWAYFPDTQTAVCNMRDLVENAFAITRRHEEDKTIYIGLRTLIWKGLIEGFAHELHHCQSFITGEITRKSDDETKQAEEEEANQYAVDMMVKLAQTIDVEIDLGEKLEKILAEFWQSEFDEAAESDDEKDERWANVQSLMMDKGWTYHIDKDPELDGKSVTLNTMKEYLAWVNGASLDDDEWSLETTGIIQEVVEEPAKPVYTQAEADMVDNSYYDMCDEESYEEAMAMAETPGMQGTTQFGAPQTVGFQAPQFTQPVATPQQGSFQAQQQIQTQPQTQFQPQAGGSMPTGFQPPNIQQNQNPAAAVPGVGTYPPHNQDMQSVLRSFYEKCFVQIFTRCGWDGMTFTNKMAVREQIHLTPAECDIVKHMVMQDDMGTYKTMEVQGWVSGKFMDRQQLMPGFELTLAAPDGSAIIRKLLPQNPNKQSKPAELTRQGWCIMWIIDPEAKDQGKPGVRMAYVPNQGVFIQQFNPGAKTWDNVC